MYYHCDCFCVYYRSTIDKLVISQSSQVPPPMGQVFPEPSDHRRDRKRNYDYDVSVSLDSVYSFSVSTENIDLINWRAVNIPLLSSLALSTVRRAIVSIYSFDILEFITVCIKPYSSGMTQILHYASTAFLQIQVIALKQSRMEMASLLCTHSLSSLTASLLK